MTSQTLNVVIDERKRLSQIELNPLQQESLLAACQSFGKGQHSSRSVFKNYILSSEIFYVDVSSN